MTILDKIIEPLRVDLEKAKARHPTEAWPERLAKKTLPTVKNFYSALKRPDRPAVIAEIKKASPSKGLIRPGFSPGPIARDYAAHGADALSVLTEPRFFMGAPSHLIEAREAVNLPLLRKDFMVDPWQVYESRELGADAILLIMAALSDADAATLHQLAATLSLHVLVEVHDAEEAKRAVQIGAKIIGVNNRDLRTFTVDLKTTERLLPEIPKSCLTVAESGVKTREDLAYLNGLGINAVLIGETFMRARSPGQALGEILGDASNNRFGNPSVETPRRGVSTGNPQNDKNQNGGAQP